ncbi:tRNA dihydrouridine synthase DusB [Clostridium cylindrosporum]|uniref:tRNA-dihydrouridine synthase n=1 Tax=Clostridium cylindrosporum DSM 605 TaxID=1121307 RepID=A0A0J8G2W0_CLOCY|nr:tRNA dihydrouridine synthase DusB [Clostridium cylindrosporum]KMT22036.1 putative tRNA-dihydrouridine synthase 1 [Clostridium cylindrosporum DSM 605]
MKIGNFVPDNNVFLAPMAGVTDKSYRIICKSQDCGMVYTEMISSKGMYYGSKRTGLMLDIDPREGATAVQIFGSDPDIMGFMAETIGDNEKVSIIDINMGCPAPKIVKNCDGSALMKDPKTAEKVVKKVVEKAKKPVTVKIRKGWDDSLINAVEFAKMLEAAGASAITIHGRTRAQMYEGVADWDIIKKVKEAISVPLIGNGDVKSPESAKKLIEYTGCDGIMIGRAAMGNPFIFKRVVHYLKTGEIIDDVPGRDKIDTALYHLSLAEEFKGHTGVIEMRKHIAWYIKGMKDAAAVRDAVNKMTSKEEMESFLLDYRKSIIL